MVCNKWESEGLLMTSDELSSEDKAHYLQHLEICNVCQEELQSYTYMKDRFFIRELLFDEVPESVHIPTFQTPQKMIFFTPLFMQIFQKALPLLIIALGTIVGLKIISPGIEKSYSAKAPTLAEQQDTLDSLATVKDSLREFREGRSDEIVSVDVSE